MNSVLEEIYSSHQVRDADGKTFEVHSHISREEGRVLTDLIRSHDISRSIEIGLAYGLSALHLCEGLADADSPRHVAVDPFQTQSWRSIGILNLERAGYSFVEVIESPSEIALPELLKAGETFHFGLIDGFHTFDQTLLDFYYLNRLLEVGGLVAIDDLWMPAVNKAVRYVLNYPAYEAVKINTPTRKPSPRRKLLEQVAKALPRSLLEGIVDDSLLRPDRELGIQGSMAVLKKVKEDERPWDWYHPF